MYYSLTTHTHTHTHTHKCNTDFILMGEGLRFGSAVRAKNAVAEGMVTISSTHVAGHNDL